MSILGKIEAILFIASKPLSVHNIAKILEVSDNDVLHVLEKLQMRFNREDSGIHILQTEDMVHMATNPEYESAVSSLVRHEVSSELTKAQLESLTVIAYQGPITRPELEEIRGVNCSVIIRNLLMRGLINEANSSEKVLPVYTLSTEALAHLGVSSVEELPNYEQLHQHQYIEHAQTQSEPSDSPEPEEIRNISP